MSNRPYVSQHRPAGATAVEEGCACSARFLEGCAAEAQAYFERLTEDGRAALDRIADCRGPTDLIMAQQAWALARLEALTASAWRVWGAALVSVPAAAADPKAVRLPD